MFNRAWHPSSQKKEVGGQQGCCLTSKIKNQTISYKNTKCAAGSTGCDASTTPSRPFNTSVVMLEDPTDPIRSKKHNTELRASSRDRITTQAPGFWRKSRPSRDLFFEKTSLVCYWALVNTEYLSLKHVLTVYPKLPIMSWIPLDQPSHSIRQAQSPLIMRMQWRQHVTEHSCTSVPPLVCTHDCVGVPTSPAKGAEVWAWSVNGLLQYVGISKIRTMATLQPHSESALKNSGVEKYLPNGTAIDIYNLEIHFVLKEK